MEVSAGVGVLGLEVLILKMNLGGRCCWLGRYLGTFRLVGASRGAGGNSRAIVRYSRSEGAATRIITKEGTLRGVETRKVP